MGEPKLEDEGDEGEVKFVEDGVSEYGFEDGDIGELERGEGR